MKIIELVQCLLQPSQMPFHSRLSGGWWNMNLSFFTWTPDKQDDMLPAPLKAGYLFYVWLLHMTTFFSEITEGTKSGRVTISHIPLPLPGNSSLMEAQLPHFYLCAPRNGASYFPSQKFLLMNSLILKHLSCDFRDGACITSCQLTLTLPLLFSIYCLSFSLAVKDALFARIFLYFFI